MNEADRTTPPNNVMAELAGIEAEIERRASPPQISQAAVAVLEAPVSAPTDPGVDAASEAAAHSGTNGGARIAEIEERFRDLEVSLAHVAANAREFSRLDGAADWAAFARTNSTQTAASLMRLSEASDRGGQPLLASALRALAEHINRIERALGGR